MSAFSYGQSQARNHAHVATWACHLGTFGDQHRRFPGQGGGGDAERRRHADAPGARGRAVKRVEVEIDGVVTQAELNEAGARARTAALRDALPIEARLEYAKRSGRVCRFRLPALATAVRIGASGVPDISGHPPRSPRPARGADQLRRCRIPDRSSGWSTASGSTGWPATSTPCSRFWRACTTKTTSASSSAASRRPKTTPGEGDCSSEVQHRRAELPGGAAQPDRTGRSVAVRGFVENLYPGPQPLLQNKVGWEKGSKSSRFRRNAVLAGRARGARSGTG